MSYQITFQKTKLLWCHLVADYRTNLDAEMMEKCVNLHHPTTHKAPKKTSQFWSDRNLQYTVASIYLFYFKTPRCNNFLTCA